MRNSSSDVGIVFLLMSSFAVCTGFSSHANAGLDHRIRNPGRRKDNIIMKAIGQGSDFHVEGKRSVVTSLNVATLESTLNPEVKYSGDAGTERRTYLDDGFVFGLEGSGLERPKGEKASLVVPDDSLETTRFQIGLVWTTLMTQAMLCGFAMNDILSLNQGDFVTSGLQIMITMASTWVLADLGSGIFHWAVDNYGNGRTPVLGSIISAFQGHHSAQLTITQRGFCNNVHKLCIPFGIPTVLLVNALSGPKITLFLTLFCALEIMSQELHKWSHMSRKQVPQLVNILQDARLIVSRKPHAKHHTAPYDGNYCIVSGFCNDILDSSGVFRRMEHIIYKWNGVESNAWKLDDDLRRRTLEGIYTPKL